MKIMDQRFKDVIICSLMVSAALTAPAYAYLDPASGSALSAAILGFFATIAYVVRKQFYKFIRLFRGKSSATK